MSAILLLYYFTTRLLQCNNQRQDSLGRLGTINNPKQRAPLRQGFLDIPIIVTTIIARTISVSQNECPNDNIFLNINSVSPARRQLFLIVAMKFFDFLLSVSMIYFPLIRKTSHAIVENAFQSAVYFDSVFQI